MHMKKHSTRLDDNTASGNISDVVTGLYNILVFDQGSNVVAVELLNVIITGEPFSLRNIPTPASSNIPTPSASKWYLYVEVYFRFILFL